ncbi:MAG: polyprenyl synthetase family protein [Nitrosomonadales bacterium]
MHLKTHPKELTQELIQNIDNIIKTSLQSEVPLINQISQYIINSGGKRIRPLFLLYLAGMTSKENTINSSHYHLAGIIELIHTATLLHDDVVDESEKRRGNWTANSKYGNSASVLVGDFIYSRSFQMMVNVNQIEVMDVLSKTTNMIAEGEVLQLLNKNNPSLKSSDYFKVIEMKTAILFCACGELVAIVNRLPLDQRITLTKISMLFGTIYQLIDDVLDYMGSKEDLGKNIGDDLKEGKMTLPVILALEKCNSDEKEMIEKAFSTNNLEFLDKIKIIIKKYNSVEKVKKQIDQLTNELFEKLDLFPDNIYKFKIIEFITASLKRTS